MKASGFAMAIALLVTFLTINAPARLLPLVMPSDLVLDGMTGTLWRGSAARSVVLVQQKRVALGETRWQLDPWSLATLRPRLTFETVWGGQSLSGRVAFDVSGRVALDNVEARLTVDFLRQLIPLYVGGRLDGRLARVEIDRDGSVRARGRVDWLGAAWKSAAGDVRLGNYRLDITSDEGRTLGRVTTFAGPLQVAGDLTLANARYAINLDLSGPGTRNQALVDAFQLLASPTARGYEIVLSGNL